jgi:hypothetical protein
MKHWYPALCLILLAACRSNDATHASPTSNGEEITFIVHGPVHPGELKGDHFFLFALREGDDPERTLWIPMLDQSSTNAVCAEVAAGFEDNCGPALETKRSVLTTARGAETAASFVLPPPWHLVSVTVERRDRDDGPRVLDMTQVEVLRDGQPLTNTSPPSGANTPASLK